MAVIAYITSVLMFYPVFSKTPGTPPKSPCLEIIHNKCYSCEGLGLQEIPDNIPTSTETLDFSFNTLFTLNPWTFSHLEKLEYLDLSRCRITWIYEYVFRNNTRLNTVLLTGNPIVFIADNAFIGATFLRHLYLQETTIKDLDFVPLETLPSLESLHMGSNSISSLKFPKDVTLNNLRILNLEFNRINKISAKDSEDIKQINNLTLILRGNNIEYIEPNSFNASNFFNLDLTGSAENTDLSSLVNGLNGLTTNILKLGTFLESENEFDVAPWSLSGLCNVSIKEFILQFREFTDQSPQTLSCLGRTQLLDLTFTHMHYLPRFSNGSSLKELILNENKFDSLCNISSDSYPLVTHLHICGNVETLDLGAGCLKNLSRLKYLDLSNNNFRAGTCCRSQFTGLHSLTHLNLSYVVDLSLDSPAFPENIQLESLDFTNVLLKTGDSLSPFSNLASLKVLNMSHSHINGSNINFLVGLKNLVYLNMEKNTFQRGILHSNNLFLNVIKLETLILINCDLQVIEGQSFQKLKNLKYVDLSHNKLTVLNTNAFWNLSHIYLNFASNMIMAIAIDLVQNITDESIINLSYNPINCSCSNIEFLSWYKRHANIFQDKKNTKCGSPSSLNGTELSTVSITCGKVTSQIIIIIVTVLMGILLVVCFIQLYRKRLYTSI